MSAMPNLKAQRELFNLLEAHFDPDKGAYTNGYSDGRIAKETGLSPNYVKDTRVAAYGKLKPPTELDQAVIDLRALEDAYLKTETEMKAAIKDLRTRIQALQKRFD